MILPPHILARAASPGKTKPAKARPRESKLNKTEQRYATLLELRKRAGEIQDYHSQDITLVIGDGCRYTPDFLIIENNGDLTFIEIKGFMKAVGAAKFRVAKRIYWWAQFKLVRWLKGQWVESDDAVRDARPGELRASSEGSAAK